MPRSWFDNRNYPELDVLKAQRLERRINTIESALTFVGCVAAALALWWLVVYVG